LLQAKAIYNGTVPDGEEAHLFQFSVITVNNDCKTVPLILMRSVLLRIGTPSKTTLILDYKIEMLNADHELFNVHLGQVNKQVNDLRESERKKEQDKKVRPTNVVQVLDDKFYVKKIDGYSLLVAEFVAEHLMQAGPNAGKKNTKQDWSMFFIFCTALCYV
jgi:hypothetical protein